MLYQTKAKKGIHLLEQAVYDDLVSQLADLKVSNHILDKLVLHSATNRRRSSAKSDDEPKRKFPDIPLENQCGTKCKSGKICTNAICDKKLHRCWAHMSKEQREFYQSTKKVAV